MSKSVKSKLDAFTVSLDEWFGVQKLTLEEVKKKLKDDGCIVSLSRLSRWWEARQAKLSEEKLLEQIATGADTVKRIESQFADTAPPGLKLIIPLLRVLILNLSTQATLNPSLLELVTLLLKPVMEFAKLEVKQQELKLSRERFSLEACTLFVDWFADKKAQQIMASNKSNAEKIAALRSEYFKDVDALQQSGAVKLPE